MTKKQKIDWQKHCERARAEHDAIWGRRCKNAGKHRCDGRTFQIYGEDGNNGMVWAGVYHAPRMSVRIARKIHRRHTHWRRAYDTLPENLSRDYPAKHDKPVRFLIMHPIDNHEQAARFSVA